MTRYYSPLRYPGGKNCIFEFVVQILKENDLIGSSYAEPYAGGAGLALRLLLEGYVNQIYINDLDVSIYALWKTITESSEKLCKWIEDVEVSIESWYYYRQIYQHKTEKDQDMFELAKATFFLNRTNVSGVIKGGVIGGFKQQGMYKIGARFNKSELIRRIEKISEVSNRVIVSNLDGLSFVKKLENKDEQIFLYLDPPYYKKGAELYMNFFANQDHIKLSEYVHKMKNAWMVSYDHSDFILKLYTGKRMLSYKLAQNTSNRIGDEILVFSDQICFKQSMNYLKSPSLIR